MNEDYSDYNKFFLDPLLYNGGAPERKNETEAVSFQFVLTRSNVIFHHCIV